MARQLQSTTACLRQFLLISAASHAALVDPLSSAENCTGPRTYDEYMEMTFGNRSGYGRLTRPNQARDALNKSLFADLAPPEDVQIQMNIQQVNFVNDATQSYKIFVMQTLVWVDWRLRHKGCLARKYVNIRYEELNRKMWMPDVYAVNSADNEFLKGGCMLYLDGVVICTTYHSYELTCSMDFAKMPFDEQHCHIEMRVFAGTAREVKIRPMTTSKPIVLPTKRVGTVEWNLTHVDVTTDILTIDADTEESRVFFKLILRRESGYYVKQVIIPTIGIILICWLSFFVTKGAVPARCALTVIAFLTFINHINDITSKLPRGATDVWLLQFLGGSRWFAFIAILEYGVVNVLTRYEEALTKSKAAAEQKHKEDEDELKHLEAGHSSSAEKRPADGELVQRKAKATVDDVDSFAPEKQVPRQSGRPAFKPGNGREENDTLCSTGVVSGHSWVSSMGTTQQEQQQLNDIQPEKIQGSMAFAPYQPQSVRSIKHGVTGLWHGACTTWLIMKKDGNMRLKDIDVDVFARCAYPIAYAVFFLVMIGHI